MLKPKHKGNFMDSMQELQRLRRLCFLAFFEVRHLKQLLITHGVIPQDDTHDYANALEEYMRDLESKDKLLSKDYPGLSDDPPKRSD
jgi:hypothetical protein